ncbi:MAG: ribosome silencing factor [Armatimonadetes bacterium]|nr:ribosome silencing factor [Armatimonadota bacterium]
MSELVLDICRIADEKRGNEILVMEIAHLLPIASYFVVVTCENPIHIDALASELEERIENKWNIRVRREGEPQSRWVILDFGDVIVHLFDNELRQYYDLEGLWADAPMMKWDGKLTKWERLKRSQEVAAASKRRRQRA